MGQSDSNTNVSAGKCLWLEITPVPAELVLVWNILSHPLSGGVRRLIPGVANTPLGMTLTLGLCLAEANGWVLLFWGSLSFEFLGNFLVIDLRFFHWGLFVGRGFGVQGNCFLY